MNSYYVIKERKKKSSDDKISVKPLIYFIAYTIRINLQLKKIVTIMYSTYK